MKRLKNLGTLPPGLYTQSRRKQRDMTTELLKVCPELSAEVHGEAEKQMLYEANSIAWIDFCSLLGDYPRAVD